MKTGRVTLWARRITIGAAVLASSLGLLKFASGDWISSLPATLWPVIALIWMVRAYRLEDTCGIGREADVTTEIDGEIVRIWFQATSGRGSSQ